MKWLNFLFFKNKLNKEEEIPLTEIKPEDLKVDQLIPSPFISENDCEIDSIYELMENENAEATTEDFINDEDSSSSEIADEFKIDIGEQSEDETEGEDTEETVLTIQEDFKADSDISDLTDKINDEIIKQIYKNEEESKEVNSTNPSDRLTEPNNVKKKRSSKNRKNHKK